MLRVLRRSVVDLVAATGAGSADGSGGIGLSGFGQKREVADLHGEFVAISGVAETASHAAAAGVENAQFVARDAAEHVGAAACSPQCFLMAVAVEEHGGLR